MFRSIKKFNKNPQLLKSINQNVNKRFMGCCHWFEPQGEGKEDIFQIDVNTLKYGDNALREVGMDAKEQGMSRVAIFTDKGQIDMPHVHTTIEALKKEGIDYAVFDEVRIEPTDTSFKEAIKFAKDGKFDGYISVGGGSVIDTCKAADLYASSPDSDFLDFVNAPVGRGLPIKVSLAPHIACPTTAGTGSESTGLAIFDFQEMHAKTGVATRSIRPSLGVIDPTTTKTMPKALVAASGFDVLSHSIESYTARPYTRRDSPDRPYLRPMSQGANPWSDIGCEEALKLTGKYLVRAVNDPDDYEAREKMMFASTLAGVSFGNVGCHMPHGLSYSVSGMVKDDFKVDGYYGTHALIPHGYSVILNAPAVFRFTAKANPERHLRAAELLGADIRGVDFKDAGEVLAQRIIELMKAAHIPNGLTAVGYEENDVNDLAKGAMPQKRLLENAPIMPDENDVRKIYEDAMKYW